MRHPSSGTLGNLQLVVFANAASGEAAQATAKDLGFVRVRIEAGNVTQATEFFAQNASPEILLVEIGNAEEAPAQLDALAEMLNPHSKVLATGTVDSIRFYQWLSELGIDGYLLQPFTPAEMKHAIAKGSVKKPDASVGSTKTEKKIIAVMGARGGVGTTLIATNLAAIFAQTHATPTALVDLDAYFGCVALALDLEPGRGLHDAFEKPERVDGLFLERVMVKPFANLAILAAEEPLADMVNAQPNAGEMIFAALREKFDVMVVDVPRQMTPLTRYVLAAADVVLIVAEPQITSLRDSLRVKDYLVDTIKRPAPQVLLNRIGLSAANELSLKEFEKHFGSETSAHCAFSHEIVAATAQGELLGSTPKLKAWLAPLHRLAQEIMGDKDEGGEAETPAPASLLSRLTGRK